MKNRSNFKYLKRVLNRKDPIDRRILDLVKANKLSFCFTPIVGEHK